MAFVLIVEDEEPVRILAECYLKHQGHRTLSTATVEEALAVLAVTSRIDLLFTDIDLLGDRHAGLRLAQQARARRPGLKVLYTTGQSATTGMIARFVPGSALLPKPYTAERLWRSLAVHFGIEPPALTQQRQA